MKLLSQLSGADKTLAGDGWRFLLAGGINTLLTLLLYQALVSVLSARMAWTIAWFSGLLLISLAYPKMVFKRGVLTARRFCLNIAYYLCSYLISLGLLSLFTDGLSLGPRLAAFAVLAVTVPLNFVFSRLIFTFMADKP